MDWSKYNGKFKEVEFDCKCGCKTNNISKDLIDKLYLARIDADIPFKINSGCRCKTHNANSGGKSDSAHLTGKAVDIACNNGVTRLTLIYALINVGFNRIGIHPKFIHVDIDETKPQGTIFLY
jgi:zinc D-Ala-D-Ala carboxypeptidase